MSGSYINPYDNIYPYSKKAGGRFDSSQPVNVESLGSKVPPHSIDAEMAVLGAMMLDKQAISKVIEILDIESFYSEAHRKIYEAVLWMFNHKTEVDIITLTEELIGRKFLEEVGGTAYLSELNRKTPTASNVEHYAMIVQEKYLKRVLIAVSGKILSNAYDDSTDALEEIDNAEAEIFKLSDKRFHKGYVKIKPVVLDAFKVVESHVGKEKQGFIGIPSGFKKLDDILGGFHNSDFIVIAGRPSMGKTALALSIARNIAIEYKRKVGFFSIEMEAQQLALRLLAAEAKVNSNDVRIGKVTPDTMRKIIKIMDKLTDAPIILDDSASLTVMELRAKCRRLIAEFGIEIVIVDYLQLIRSPKAESREREISMISQSLKQMAKELKIPIIALAQLNRSVESRNDKRPLLSDLRESGSIEQDSDVVLFVHRPEYYKIKTYEDNTPTEGTAEVIIGKHRNGPVGVARLAFVKEQARFENLAFEYRDIPEDFVKFDGDEEEEPVF